MPRGELVCADATVSYSPGVWIALHGMACAMAAVQKAMEALHCWWVLSMPLMHSTHRQLTEALHF